MTHIASESLKQLEATLAEQNAALESVQAALASLDPRTVLPITEEELDAIETPLRTEASRAAWLCGTRV